MKKFIALLLSMMLFAMTSVAALPTDDIVDTAIDNGNFTILVQALEAAGLVDTLRGDGPFTVFAPTDDAFADLLAELDITAAELLAHPRLKEVLLFHVVSGQVVAADIQAAIDAEDNGQFITTTALGMGELLIFDGTDDGPLSTGGSLITLTDLFASNGVIHVIDKVLIPDAFFIEFTTVVDVALSDDDFSILVAALTKAGLVSALQGAGPFTVFAPTNAAFAELLAKLDITAEELLAQSDLSKVLLYHVIPGLVKAEDITDGLVKETLNAGNSLTFTLGSVFVNGTSEVVVADLLALNGVVHVIDEVLVPANFALDDPIPDTSDNNLMVWMGLLLALGSALVIIARSFTKKVTA